MLKLYNGSSVFNAEIIHYHKKLSPMSTLCTSENMIYGWLVHLAMMISFKSFSFWERDYCLEPNQYEKYILSYATLVNSSLNFCVERVLLQCERC